MALSQRQTSTTFFPGKQNHFLSESCTSLPSHFCSDKYPEALWKSLLSALLCYGSITFAAAAAHPHFFFSSLPRIQSDSKSHSNTFGSALSSAESTSVHTVQTLRAAEGQWTCGSRRDAMERWWPERLDNVPMFSVKCLNDPKQMARLDRWKMCMECAVGSCSVWLTLSLQIKQTFSHLEPSRYSLVETVRGEKRRLEKVLCAAD